MKFITMTSQDFAKLVGKVGKSASEYNRLVQDALTQSVFQLTAYGNTAYADRLFSAVRSADKKRVASYLAEHGKVYTITDKQRKQASDKGKPIDSSRVFAKVANTSPDTSTPEAKTLAEENASDLVAILPDWVEWNRAKAATASEEKPVKFGQTFGRLLESLDTGKIQEVEMQQVKAFKSFAQFIQTGISYDDLRKSIISEYEQQIKTPIQAKAVKSA